MDREIITEKILECINPNANNNNTEIANICLKALQEYATNNNIEDKLSELSMKKFGKDNETYSILIRKNDKDKDSKKIGNAYYSIETGRFDWRESNNSFINKLFQSVYGILFPLPEDAGNNKRDINRILKKNNTEKKDVEQDESGNNYKILNFPRNIILYGPPGTGKTRYTAIYAALIGGWEIECPKEIEVKNGQYKYFHDKDMSLQGLIDVINSKDELYNEAFDYYKGMCETEFKNNIDKCYQGSFVTFHQSYSYEEFIEGIKPETTEDNNVIYVKENGIFKAICNIAKKREKKKFVLIIDEINRGNISKVFGELITAIEEERRSINIPENSKNESIDITLPYTKEKFTVPENVYIIGTMNTADRSIALMDTALRRRFTFIEMMPKPELLGKITVIDKKNNKSEISLDKMLKTINQRIEVLYDREHTIGHAYFTSFFEKNEIDIEDLGNVFKNKIIPLLQEYFYDDYEKIALVLGEDINDIKVKDDNKNEFSHNIVEKVEYKSLFKSKDKELIEDNPVYRINNYAFNNIETYLQIFEPINTTDTK